MSNMKIDMPAGKCDPTLCERPMLARGYCDRHYQEARRRADGRPRRPRGPNGSFISKDGYKYVLCKGHPGANSKGQIREHRLVMEGVLRRYLLPGENVHHRNGVKNDNRPENLELWITTQPSGQRPEDLVEWAQEILRRYA